MPHFAQTVYIHVLSDKTIIIMQRRNQHYTVVSGKVVLYKESWKGYTTVQKGSLGHKEYSRADDATTTQWRPVMAGNMDERVFKI